MAARDPDLPPGQRPGAGFPRFGASVWRPPPRGVAGDSLRISGDVELPGALDVGALAELDRQRRVGDLHCVTSWSKVDLEWQGVAFRELWERLLVPRFRPAEGVAWVVFFGADGYRATLTLEDALDRSVLLADRLDGEPLGVAHGAPLRLVTPGHYGYKSVKHVTGLGLLRRAPKALPLGLEHRRGRVALEERHAFLPPWLVRWPYRLLIPGVAAAQRRSLSLADYAGRPTQLERVLPRSDASELHQRWLAASVEESWAALLATTAREVRLLGPLMALRRLPAWLLRRSAGGGKAATPLFGALQQAGFVQVAEEPGREIVFAVIGRFWSPIGNRPVRGINDLADFAGFDEPGYAKAAISFLARREGAGTRLLTETRVLGTDAVARRRFLRYWRLVRPGSGAIRRSWLAAIGRRVAGGRRLPG